MRLVFYGEVAGGALQIVVPFYTSSSLRGTKQSAVI
jgi:hypothetical protein